MIDQQARAARTSRDAPPPAEPATRIVTVCSTKGGTGKTTIATNLAAALHARSHRVCLIDLDLEFGDAAISLRLQPTRSLVDAIGMDVTSSDDAVATLVTPFRPGLDCILAPIEPGAASRIPPEVVTNLLALLRHRYDVVVIDTSSNLSEHVLAALDSSDHHVLIANPEIPSLKNLRLALDMLDLLRYPHSARSIVFNRADDAAGLGEADVRAALKAPIAACVPASRDVPVSINRGVPIVTATPNHQVSRAIRRFAAEVINGESVLPTRRGGVAGLFRRGSS